MINFYKKIVQKNEVKYLGSAPGLFLTLIRPKTFFSLKRGTNGLWPLGTGLWSWVQIWFTFDLYTTRWTGLVEIVKKIRTFGFEDWHETLLNFYDILLKEVILCVTWFQYHVWLSVILFVRIKQINTVVSLSTDMCVLSYVVTFDTVINCTLLSLISCRLCLFVVVWIIMPSFLVDVFAYATLIRNLISQD